MKQGKLIIENATFKHQEPRNDGMVMIQHISMSFRDIREFTYY